MRETGWVHHVSFDDLAPSIVDDEVEKAKENGYILGTDRYGDFIHTPPQFSPPYGSRYDSNVSGEWSSPPSSFHTSGALRTSLRARLPPAPDVSSLKPTKGYVSRDSSRDYDLETMNWQEEREMDKDTDLNTEMNSANRCRQHSQKKAHGPTNDIILPSRKTFAGMSDEELSELEDLYKSRSWSTQKSTIDKFDFHEQRSLILDESSSKNSGFKGALVDPLTPVYPTRPVVTHRAISLTTQNVHFEEPRRVVLCYISGRRHSWSAADWYVENASHNGDYFVIVTTVSNFEDYIMENGSSRHSLKLTRSLSAIDSQSSTRFSPSCASQSPLSMGIQLSEIHEKAKATCKNMLNYYAFRLNGKLIRITVEMIKENSSKNTITNSINLYKPDLQIVSTVSANVQIKFRNGKMKLANFIMRHYCVPTCVVPYEFIDPRLLREDAGTSFDEPGTLAPQEQRLLPPKVNSFQDHLKNLDKIVIDTLSNPFVQKDTKGTRNEIASVRPYFPTSNQQLNNAEFFERVGYVRPRPCRSDACLDRDNSTNKSSGSLKSSTSASNFSRSSRIYHDETPTIYKVRSLIDTDLEGQNNHHKHSNNHKHSKHHSKKSRNHSHSPKKKAASTNFRSTKSSGTSPISRDKDFHKSKSTGVLNNRPSPKTGNYNDIEHKKKKTVASFFKKVFG